MTSPTPVVSPAAAPPISTPTVSAPPEPPAPPSKPTAPAPVLAQDGERVLPSNAWARVHEHVKAQSVPTAALLEQQAAIERWDADGAVVVRIAKAYKEMFDKQAAKKKLLAEAIAAVFGTDAFPRLEVGDPKAVKPAAAKPAAAPKPVAPPPIAPAPVAPTPAPVQATPPSLRPMPEALDDIPPAEPPDWFDEIEDAGPAGPPAAPGAPSSGDPALSLVVDLFNGRVTTPPQA